MEDIDLYLTLVSFAGVGINPAGIGLIFGFLGLILLLLFSALISGSEVAYFSLSPVDLNHLENKKHREGFIVKQLLENQGRLLATIVIANNFVNIAIVILSTILADTLFDFSSALLLGFLFKIVGITFLLLLFGEILPKLYANSNPVGFSLFMSRPLFLLESFFKPLSSLLIGSTTFLNRRMNQKKENMSINELSQALDITAPSIKEDKKILKGIVNFGNKAVTEIMKPRIDVLAVSTSAGLNKLIAEIIESGYSRIPVYTDTFDNVKGVLYVKDLLPHHRKGDSFRWQTLIRPPYFVPETKRISDLLKEFQTQKMHMAIVIDEYGGTTGIVTMEDILEEIIGEISDEFDLEELYFSKLDDKNYIFEGKTPINDFNKILNLEPNIFDDIRGDADTLAGLILEYEGEIPSRNKKIIFKQFTFTIESADNRRIKQIKVTIN